MSPGSPAGSGLTVSTQGALDVTWNGAPVPHLGKGKLAALLAYLAVEPGQHRREALADLFWPDLPAEAARLNLRQSLFQLRAALREATGRDFVAAGRHHAGLVGGPALRVPAVDLAESPPACTGPDPARCPACLARMAALAECHRGAFLADVVMPDCPGFEDWMLCKRESLHRHALDLLARLADCHERGGDHRAALPYALRYVEMEPWSEAGQLRAMRLYALDGRREAALSQYETCRRALERELGVAPNAELRGFAERIRAESVGALPSPAAAPAAPAERRQVTVLYCEAEMPGVDEPDEAVAALRASQSRFRDIVVRHAGHPVPVYSGGLLAYFGYPHAQENTAVHALRAALALARESSPALAVRVGVHSGLIVTSPETQVPDAVGTTSGVAVNLRERAGPGEVAASAETRRRVAGYFQFAELAAGASAGEAYRVLGESGAGHRLAAAERLAPLTGREAELARLLRAWARARKGETRALLLSGEAGIGKSRLADALARRIASGSGMVRELRCFPETRQSPWHPLIALLAELAGFADGDDAALRRDKLDALLRARAPGLAETGNRLLGPLLGLAPEEPPVPPAQTPAQSRGATRDLLAGLIRALAAPVPLLLVVEDMHWCDDLTLDLMSSLAQRPGRVPLLVLMTARPEWRPRWPRLEILDLAPLPDADVDSLLGALRADLAPARRARIVALAEGVPLFAEELAAMPDGRDGDLPANLSDLLMARLDALGPARATAQWAATIGREFSAELLAAVSGQTAEQLADAVRRMRESGLVRVAADGGLQFKHALVQEAAYLSQTRPARKAAHRRVAEALARLRADTCGEHPELLARHWGLAGEAARAVPLWLAAGTKAASRFAHRAAVALHDAGLAALAALPQGGERDRLEFALLVGLAQSEQAVAGYGRGRSPELLARAVALLERGVGSGADLFRTVWGLWEGAGSRVGHMEAVRLAQRLVEIAGAERATDLLAQAEYALGNSLFWVGDPAASRRHLEAALALLAPDAEAPLRDCYGSIVAIGIHVYLSWGLWLQGHDAEAGEQGDAALALARRHGDAYGLAFALTFAATLRRWRGDAAGARELAEEGRTVAAGCESAVFAAALAMVRGWAAVMAGDAKALAVIEQAVGEIRTAMSGVVVPLLAPYAEALLFLGETAWALPVLDEALRQVETTQDRHYLAELHRMRGLCLLARGRRKAAMASFGKALATASEQGATVFEHRARECLARVRQSGSGPDS